MHYSSFSFSPRTMELSFFLWHVNTCAFTTGLFHLTYNKQEAWHTKTNIFIPHIELRAQEKEELEETGSTASNPVKAGTSTSASKQADQAESNAAYDFRRMADQDWTLFQALFVILAIAGFAYWYVKKRSSVDNEREKGRFPAWCSRS